MLGRSSPGLPCDVVFESYEWQSVYAVSTKEPIPKEPPTLHTIIIMMAKLKGSLGRKSDGHSGIKVMWTRMQSMKDFAQACPAVFVFARATEELVFCRPYKNKANVASTNLLSVFRCWENIDVQNQCA